MTDTEYKEERTETWNNVLSKFPPYKEVHFMHRDQACKGEVKAISLRLCDSALTVIVAIDGKRGCDNEFGFHYSKLFLSKQELLESL